MKNILIGLAGFGDSGILNGDLMIIKKLTFHCILGADYGAGFALIVKTKTSAE